MRSAGAGAWQKMTVAHLEECGWEFAWRQTMVGRSNLDQLEDLLRRVLKSGRATEYREYWESRQQGPRGKLGLTHVRRLLRWKRTLSPSGAGGH